ncbi:MAG: hypothetical protein Q7J27_12380 [Syntrophales bacterium]|nr:hypothetical protein [Syntrophales bacterium]
MPAYSKHAYDTLIERHGSSRIYPLFLAVQEKDFATVSETYCLYRQGC